MKNYIKLIVTFLVLTFSIAYVLEHIEWKGTQSESKEVSKDQYKVIGVKDGDTFVILKDGKEQTVRFKHIDCPEKAQDYGKVAKQFTSDACFNKFIQLKGKEEYDKYNRLLAEIILEDGRNLNQELVKNGLAWRYKHSNEPIYFQLEEEARKAKLNIWSVPNPTPPWDWRKGKNKQ
jgi:micrococcal nuclease